MTGEGVTVGMPLRAGDPAQLGDYRLLRRLGEGGMGSVYLAESGGGRLVALKVIRADLVEEPEFRRRFRSEVARAQEVPPFCTAEVLDAAPDHETPYLVVEYVDGPSLDQVVRERGPLTPANLHGLAIGVATALTAIHGAGVIHRDLKPSNVLLAPGTPKVIDFGIAQATEAANHETRTDQLMGTVAYMAPERLDPGVQRTLTPAADIFAWGAVVAYAATGRVPFTADSPPATAIAILTRPPDLDGIAEPLRDLVRRALAKNPKARPTARELLDELLSDTTRRPRPGSAGPRDPVVGGHPASDRAGNRGTDATTEHIDAEALDSGLANAYIDVTTDFAASKLPPPAAMRPSGGTPVGDGERRRPWRGVGIAALILLVVASAGTLAGIISGVISLPDGGRGAASTPAPSTPAASTHAITPATPPPSPSPSASTSSPTMPAGFSFPAITDPLTSRAYWTPSASATYHATCVLDASGLRTTLTDLVKTRTFRCDGPPDNFTDFQVTVTATLIDPDSCAAIWFRFQGKSAGYVVRVCADEVQFGTHAGSTLTALRSVMLATPLALSTPIRLSVITQGDTFTVARCAVTTTGCGTPQVLAQAEDGTFATAGTIQLGIFEPGSVTVTQAYQVTFANIEIMVPTTPSSTP